MLEKTLEIVPDFAPAYNDLGYVLAQQDKIVEAEAAYRRAIQFDAEEPNYRLNLGDVLRRKGQFRESLAQYRRSHELGSKNPHWPYPSAQWVKDGERLVELDSKLPAVLKGEQKSPNPAEAAALAELCLTYKRLPAAAVWFILVGAAFAAFPVHAGPGAYILSAQFATADPDGDGLIDYLNVSVELQPPVDGAYTVALALRWPTTGTTVASAGTTVVLSADLHTLTFRLDGPSIREKQLDGPYNLTVDLPVTIVAEE